MLPPQDKFIDGSHVRTVELAQAGDSEAFTVLIRSHEGEIYGYLVGMVGNDEEARDLMQETVIKIWQKLPTLQDLSLFRPWAYAIARNQAYDHLRQRQRHSKKASSQSWEDLKVNDEIVDTSDFEGNMEGAEFLKQALAEVPQKYRNCFLLQVVGGFSQQEVADQVGISKASVSVYVSKARRQLRERLQYLGVGLGREEKGDQPDERI